VTAGRVVAAAVLVAACVGGAVWWGRARGAAGGEAGAAGETAGPVDALEQRAKELLEQRRYDEAADAYVAAAEQAEQLGDARRARALRSQSAIPLKLAGRVEEARALLLPALEQARAEGDTRSEGLALGNLVRVEDLSDNLRGALEYRDALIEFAARTDDPRLEVWTLEQAAANAARLGDLAGALARIDRALERDELLEDDERRHDALLAQKAGLHAEAGDAEGAWAIWSGMSPTAASLANRALYLARWGLHAQAIDNAWRAVQAFEELGAAGRVERDQALLLYLDELIVSGEMDECSAQLERVFAAGDDDSLDPFRVVRARQALAQGRLPDALADLRAVQGRVAGTPDAEELGLLLAAALLSGQQDDEAQALLESLPDGQARDLLLGTLRLRQPPADTLIGEALGDLRPEAQRPGDRTLKRLREQFPLSLPSMALLSLEVGLADAARLREAQSAQAADALLAAAIHDALDWQAEELEIPGWTPDAGQRQARSARLDGWVAGRLPEGEAVLAVLLGDSGSYLVLCAPGRVATTFTLPSASALVGQAAAVVAALHDSDPVATARAGWSQFRTLFPDAARTDLEGLHDWTLILPDGLSAAPPALLVTTDPGAPDSAPQSGAINWLVLDHALRVLPCVPSRAEAAAAGGGWLALGQPQVDSAAMPLAGHAWLDRFGLNVFNSGAPRAADGGDTLTGGDASVAELRRRLGGLDGARLSVPAAGCGLLGGLALSPSTGSQWGDENAGLLPWHRLPQLPLPPELVVDTCRFHPDDQRYGPSWAAACALVRSRSLLLTRWPVREDLRQAFVARVAAARKKGLDLGAALSAVQRDYLITAFEAGDVEAMHPQLWGAWLAFEDN